MSSKSCFKSIFLFFLSFLLAGPLIAQPKFIKNGDYDSLVNIAKEQHKPMFVVVQPYESSYNPFQFPISQKTQDVLSNQYVSGIIHIVSEDINHPLAKAYLSTYARFFLFTDSDGFPLLRYDNPITTEHTLIQLIDSVNNIAKGETMGKLIKQYKKGVRSRALLRSLLTKYQEVGHYADQQVLGDYLGQLTVQELNNFETVTFLLKSGPVYNSKIYNLARSNTSMVDSVYTSLPLSVRLKINDRINQQTFRTALDTRNANLAYELGYFASRCWESNYLRGEIGRSYYPMEYARLMKDSTSFIRKARDHYNNRWYNVEPDSLAKLDYVAYNNLIYTSFLQDSTHRSVFKTFMEARRSGYNYEQAQRLNYGALQVLKFERKDNEAVYDAIRWQKKAVLLIPDSPYFHHTLARLLYRIGFYAEAESEQQQAISYAKTNKEYKNKMKESLKKLQARLW